MTFNCTQTDTKSRRKNTDILLHISTVPDHLSTGTSVSANGCVNRGRRKGKVSQFSISIKGHGFVKDFADMFS